MLKIKKITPTGDKSWYIKWVATVIIIVGACFNSFDLQPYSHAVMCIGAGLWLIVGILWYDRALIASIACIFTVAHEGETTSTTVLILSLEEYHEDYLKQKLDTLVEKWIADKRLAQEVQVKSVQKQLSKTSEEAKAA